MRKLILAFGAMATILPASTILPAAAAAPAMKAGHGVAYAADPQRRKRYAYREWRGRDGRSYCRKPDGTTGLVVGGVAGALVGRTIDSRGDRTLGTVVGAAAGALAGREIERSGSNNRRHCR